MPATSAPVPTTTRVVHGTCHHDCPDSCGWQVTVDDGVAVQLRGNAAHPYSAGELCPKVNRFLDRVYSPDRITTPLRRVGAKGEARFEPISWDDALDEIGRRLRAIVDTHGPGAVMPFISAGNQSSIAILFPERFWNRLGAIELTGALCGAVAGAGTASALGTGKALDPVEVRHSKLILLWGTNTRLTNRHLWPFIEAARADGAQVVVIDPIRTITADSADWFVQPLPGTDVALMLGMMHVLVRDGLVDHDWVADHTIGFDELCDHVAEWTPVRAAEVCGIDAADVERLATMYGTIRPAAIRTLIGAEHHEHGAMFFRTLACLPALVGGWLERGGGYARSTGVWCNEPVDEAALTRPDLLAGRTTRSIPMGELGQALTGTAAPLGALFVIAANPLVAAPAAGLIRQGLAREDLFTVVHDQFLTDTARYADLVLPATTHVESIDAVPAWGHLYLGWNEAAIPPRGEAVSNSELHRRLAAALGFTPAADPALFEDDLTVLRAALPGVDVGRLRADGFVRVPFPADGRPWAQGGFPTRSGKVELRADGLAAIGQPVLPTYLPPAEDLLADRFPFRLMSPKTHTRFLNSSYSHLAGHAGREQPPAVELTAADAAVLGLTDGATARVWNERGSLTLPVRLTDRVAPGVVCVPWGWWAGAHGGDDAVNALSSDSPTDWGGGVPYWSTRVAVAAV
ncbi:MAG: molybdopterin-dependent oxidoreductase [Acidimicrobiales bacterium]|nr:molybdopterin-dependent oxidoreductase [Acidimicrobiales bacterium]